MRYNLLNETLAKQSFLTKHRLVQVSITRTKSQDQRTIEIIILEPRTISFSRLGEDKKFIKQPSLY